MAHGELTRTGMIPSCCQRLMLTALTTLLLVSFHPVSALSQTFESRAPRAFLYDVNSRTVLYAQRAEERFAPDSMAKILTASVVFDQLSNNILDRDTLFTISEDAWRRGGAPSGRATMFAELGSSVAVENLLRGLIIMAGNDAAIALAEGVAGTEDEFADLMNATAGALGATGSVFTNATGEPEPEMHTTVRDLVIIADRLIAHHPDDYATFWGT